MGQNRTIMGQNEIYKNGKTFLFKAK